MFFVQINKLKLVLHAAALIVSAVSVPAGDWTQYRGPNFDGSSSEKLEISAWPSGGIKAVWRTPTRLGFASFAVAKGRAFTIVMEEVDGVNREVCLSLDGDTGKKLWSQVLNIAKYDGGGNSGTKENKGGDGPRTTPSSDGDRVYILDGRLTLHCLDAQNGSNLWTVNLVKKHKAKSIRWQNAAAPIIDGDLVFVCGGGEKQSLLAINKLSGETAWSGESDQMTHASPIVADIHGERQVVFFTQKGLVSCNTKSGKVLWRAAHPFKVSTAASPIVEGDIVYCSAGYGVGAAAFRVSKKGGEYSTKQLWRKPNKLMNHWSTPVCIDGHLYGMFQFKEYGNGPLKCVELATGEIKWSKSGFGPGGVILVDGKLITTSDAGEVVVSKAMPEAYSEIGRFKAIDGKCWTHAAYSNGQIYVRSTKEGVRYDLKGSLGGSPTQP
jgi:outer membrane protein assembly factor BamB